MNNCAFILNSFSRQRCQDLSEIHPVIILCRIIVLDGRIEKTLWIDVLEIDLAAFEDQGGFIVGWRGHPLRFPSCFTPFPVAGEYTGFIKGFPTHG